MKTITFAFSAAAALAHAVGAADRPCNAGQETYLQCANRLLGEAVALEDMDRRMGDAAAASSSKLLAETPTSEGAGEVGGSTRDFLARFFAAAGLGTTSTEDANLILNLRTDFLDLGPSQEAAVRAVLHEPEVLSPMLEAIPEAIRSARTSELEKRVEDLDDVTFEISWNRQTKRLGRAPQEITRQILSASNTALAAPLADLRARYEQFLLQVQSNPDALTSTVPVDTSLDERSSAFEASLLPFVTTLAEERALFAEKFEAPSRFLADLRGNQPQLHFGFAYRRRGELVGPDSYSANLTYEHGFVNINSFLDWRKESGCSGGVVCLERYRQVMGDAAAGNGARFVVKLELGRAEDFDFALPDDSFTFHTGEVDRRVGSLTYSRRFGVRADELGEDDRVLFELSASYEDVSDDPERQDRFVAKAAWSRKVSDDLSAGLTFVYANKPEFRGDVDEELSARLGLKFTTDKPSS